MTAPTATTQIPLFTYNGPYSANSSEQQQVKALLSAQETAFWPNISAVINPTTARWLIT